MFRVVNVLNNPQNFDDILNEFFASINNTNLNNKDDVIKPVHDIRETDEAYVVNIEMAGVGKDDVSITVYDGILTIKSKRKKNEKHKFILKQSHDSDYKLEFRVGDNIDTDNITASFKNGLMILTVPKKVPNKKKIVIDIK